MKLRKASRVGAARHGEPFGDPPLFDEVAERSARTVHSCSLIDDLGKARARQKPSCAERTDTGRASDHDLGVVREKPTHGSDEGFPGRVPRASAGQWVSRARAPNSRPEERYVQRSLRMQVVKFLDAAYIDVKIAEIE